MARSFVRGMPALLKYCKDGYNLVSRLAWGDEPNDERDLFEFLGHTRSLDTAESKAKKMKLSYENIEIVTYKKPKDDI